MMANLKLTLDNYIITVNTLISAGLSSLIAFLSKKLSISVPTWEKLTSYECGFEPFGDARRLSIVGFFLVAMLFLLFDLEVVLLLPWAKQFLYTGMFVYSCVVIYILLLGTGFIYETDKGALGLSLLIIAGAGFTLGGFRLGDHSWSDYLWQEIEVLYRASKIDLTGLWPEWPKWHQWPFVQWRIDPVTKERVWRTREWAIPYIFNEIVVEQLKKPAARYTPGFWFSLGWWLRFIKLYLPAYVEWMCDIFLDSILVRYGYWGFAKVGILLISPAFWHALTWTFGKIFYDLWGFAAPLRQGQYLIEIFNAHHEQIEGLIEGKYILQVGSFGRIDLKLVLPENAPIPEGMSKYDDGTVALSTMIPNPPLHVHLPDYFVPPEPEEETDEEFEDRANFTIMSVTLGCFIALVFYIVAMEACPDATFRQSWTHVPELVWIKPYWEAPYNLFFDRRFEKHTYEMDQIAQFYYQLRPRATAPGKYDPGFVLPDYMNTWYVIWN